MADYVPKSENIIAARELPAPLTLADYASVIKKVVQNGITGFTYDEVNMKVNIKTPIVAKTADGVVMCTIYDTFDSTATGFLTDMATVVNAAVACYDNNTALKTALGSDFDHFETDTENAVYDISIKGSYSGGDYSDKTAIVQFKRDAVYYRNLNNMGVAEALDDWADTITELAQA